MTKSHSSKQNFSYFINPPQTEFHFTAAPSKILEEKHKSF